MFLIFFTLLSALSLSVIPIGLVADNDVKEIWLVKSNSSLRVDGKTNINSFNCIVPSYGKVDTLVCYKLSEINEYWLVKSILTIQIENFDCHHRMMTRDLQKTLKSDIYPVMIIDFKTLSKLPSQMHHSSAISGKADITLAGVTKSYSINFTSKSINLKNMELTGNKSILFSDFALKPPSKLGGTIKVKDKLDVEFKLQLEKAI